MPKNITLALIAHDGKKKEMAKFAKRYLKQLNGFDIIATGTTGKHLIKIGLKKTRPLLSGPLGGDAQIASEIAQKNVEAVIFFRDPLGKHPHEPDVQMLLRLCDVHNVALATNPKTASLILEGLCKNPTKAR